MSPYLPDARLLFFPLFYCFGSLHADRQKEINAFFCGCTFLINNGGNLYAFTQMTIIQI